ncbi:hypothetical protein XENTR_v10015475 [Xenopus tropicalis]|nr:hypothetical protein XENTR_v10015475 [Xenopus tropicalis]
MHICYYSLCRNTRTCYYPQYQPASLPSLYWDRPPLPPSSLIHCPPLPSNVALRGNSCCLKPEHKAEISLGIVGNVVLLVSRKQISCPLIQIHDYEPCLYPVPGL